MLWVISLLSFVCVARCARILGVFPTPSISHQVVYQPVWQELSLRGHQVTVFTPNPLKNPKLTNLTEIDMSSTYDIINRDDISKTMSKNNYLIKTVLWVANFFTEVIEENLKQSESLIKDPRRKFDLIIVETLHPLVYSYACRFKAPVIGISSLGVFLQTHDAVGNPTHPALNPDLLLNFVGEIGLYQRAYSAFYNIWYRLLYHWHILPQGDKVARKYFGDSCPHLGDIERNVSLILVNTNPILHPVRPNVPAIIEMGQMHINSKKPLPQASVSFYLHLRLNHLQNYLDRSTQGVIYFSLGSNVKSANLTENVRKVIIQALSELPYNVLWKWETDHLPDQPKNVMTQKWLPQQDLLGHKNIKAFVTQGGLQSMEEAITNGVPLIGMPFFADQPLNVMKMVNLGIARSVDHATMTKASLKEVIIEVAENEKYRTKVRELRDLLFDQPMNGLDKAVWWIEYVLRHKGARHLRSPAVDMPWYEYFLLDVAASVLLILGIVTYLVFLS
ncbi:UDP-glucuronosyltransferase 2B20-like, partial [Asbolus verrucosus]